jgi:hypothetical protein
VAVSFIDEGNQSTWRKPQTYRKSNTGSQFCFASTTSKNNMLEDMEQTWEKNTGRLKKTNFLLLNIYLFLHLLFIIVYTIFYIFKCVYE